MTAITLAMAVGLVAGVLSGVFGIGGAVVIIPALTTFLDLPQVDAHATSLAAMIPGIAVGAMQHGRQGHVDWPAAVTIGLISIGGVAGGVLIATDLSEGLLRKLFAVFLVLVALRLLWTGARASEERPKVIIKGPRADQKSGLRRG